MSYRVNPELGTEIAALGGGTFTKCFNCGNCTAVCALSKDRHRLPAQDHPLPAARPVGPPRSSRPSRGSATTAATCSDTCPREAQPGELMMATRRWLTTRYDFTGLSKRLYRSEAWEIGALARRRARRAGLLPRARPLRRHVRVPGRAGRRRSSTSGSTCSPARSGSTSATWSWPRLLFALLGINTLRMVRVRPAGRAAASRSRCRSGSASSSTSACTRPRRSGGSTATTTRGCSG